jgi:hypothetical protein
MAHRPLKGEKSYGRDDIDNCAISANHSSTGLGFHGIAEEEAEGNGRQEVGHRYRSRTVSIIKLF